MSKQDKATTDRYARTLRDLVKKPENKLCADCKKNDPRWASWNIGVFLCIRCSGIHRGMGTHISKVKSVDLDVWTPEQMESIQKWGNHLANLYWEAHLKPGHVPPEHKMESFIRSKYESKRWALEGPPPSDPSVLDTGTFTTSTPTPSKDINNVNQSTASASPSPAPHQTRQLQQATRSSVPAPAPPSSQGFTRHQLLSSNYSLQSQAQTQMQQRQVATQAPSQDQSQGKAQTKDDLFSLDFRAPTTTQPPPPSQPIKKDPKQDILSLFSSTTPASPLALQGAGRFQQQVVPQESIPTTTSMLGTSRTGMWGVSSGWQGPAPVTAPSTGFGLMAGGGAPVLPVQPNIWGAATAPSMNGMGPGMGMNGLVDTTSIWGGGSTGIGVGTGNAGMSGQGGAQIKKQDDVFGDIWGGF